MTNRNQAWVYLKSEPQLWTVGFYDPKGGWHSESDHNTPEKAAARVHYLNGGSRASDLTATSCHIPNPMKGD